MSVRVSNLKLKTQNSKFKTHRRCITMPQIRPPLPPHLKKRLPLGGEGTRVRSLIHGNGLHTVCESAKCPNIHECWAKGTATFMILGDQCTRRCTFCSVPKGTTLPVDMSEAERVADVAAALKLRHVVVTSVNRDDLEDGGAALFAACIRELRRRIPQVVVEILTPDFQGRRASLEIALVERPEIFNHNVETVPRLYPPVRPGANYKQSLQVLAEAKEICSGVKTKSGLMVGLGERRAEIEDVLRDLRGSDVDFLTIGQYLAPTPQHHPIREFVAPQVFREFEEFAYGLGFEYVASGPFVRSSYMAEAALEHARVEGKN